MLGHYRQAEVAIVVEVGELLVVDPQQVHHRGVLVANRDAIDDRTEIESRRPHPVLREQWLQGRHSIDLRQAIDGSKLTHQDLLARCSEPFFEDGGVDLPEVGYPVPSTTPNLP